MLHLTVFYDFASIQRTFWNEEMHECILIEALCMFHVTTTDIQADVGLMHYYECSCV